jgi:3-methylcrotonyl-CoA carboxylase alpha subunit
MRTFPAILVANRGEIAVRIMRTARKLGIITHAVHTPDEINALHVKSADQAWELSGSTLADTYLNAGQILAIARKSKIPAIHPGYGFLSENETFAAACENAGIIFIGPRSETIALLGDKIKAREAAMLAGLPVLTGHSGTAGELCSGVASYEYPVLVKATAGGGGLGMRIVTSADKLPGAITATSREAQAYFGSNSVYIEQYLEDPRHIEVQILGDNYGNIIHLYERECSLQRRYQKIIEEAPSPSINKKTRSKVLDMAVKFARSLGYRNAGTVEFLVDRHGQIFFLEMNSRIQVEHPVTEAVTGLDIVEEQIVIAAGHKLRHSQDQVKINGHAIECRIYAEDPSNGFLPSPGRVTCYQEPSGEGIRVDPAFDGEGNVSSNYDPLIGKVTASGLDREESRRKMITALENYGIHGIKTNISFLLGLLHNKDFISINFSTAFCEKNTGKIIMENVQNKNSGSWQLAAAGALLATLLRKKGGNPVWENLGYWRINNTLPFCFEGEELEAEIRNITESSYFIMINNEELRGKYSINGNGVDLRAGDNIHRVFVSTDMEGKQVISYRGFEYLFSRSDLLREKDHMIPRPGDRSSETGKIFSPMPGKVISVNKVAGDIVKKGEVLVIVESMKMENSILAPSDGIIGDIAVTEGEFTDCSQPLASINRIARNKMDGKAYTNIS